MGKTSCFYKSICVIIVLTIICSNLALTVTAISEKTYLYLADNGVIITFMPAEEKIKIDLPATWKNLYVDDWVICALYTNNTMNTFAIKSICSDDDIFLDVECSQKYSPICKVFVFNENLIPQTSAISCNLFTQAYSAEGWTFDYFVKYNQLINEYDYNLTKLQQELVALEDNRKESKDKIIQAKIDLEKLPSKRNSYISSRTSYHMANGAGGSQYAREMAIRDWEYYYTSQTAKLNSVIIIEEENLLLYPSQIEEKQKEIQQLTNEYNSNMEKLKKEYPFAGDEMNGGTNETDNCTFEELLQRLNKSYDLKIAELQGELSELKELCADSKSKITQARVDLTNLPTKKNSYISSRTSYHMANGAGGSQYAREMAIRDWEDYYMSQTAKLNTLIIVEEENVSVFSKQIIDKGNELEQCYVQYEKDIMSLKKKYGVELN